MRPLFVVQRYGPRVPGGAEYTARIFAEHLADRGHDVHVLTSCAVSYATWANEIPPGTTVEAGVTVHRLPVDRERDDRLFVPLNSRTAWGGKPVPLHMQREWMDAQGPHVPELAGWLADNVAGYDTASFFTYLYFTAYAGLPVAAGRVPTVLHPNAHDEPPFYLPLFDSRFHLPTVFSFWAEEEAALTRRRFGVTQPSAVTGIGFDLDVPVDVDRFRADHGVGDRPYLLYVGRIEEGKGSLELLEWFRTYKRRRPGPLALVLVGHQVGDVPDDPDIVTTGFVDDRTKESALAGAVALVMPSYFESFSQVLCEAWVHRRPGLVQGRCAVLAGQARRSGGAYAYSGFAEFEAAVDLLVEDPARADRMGEAGRAYVERRYTWDKVLDRYERLLALARRLRPVSAPAPRR
jgi:glycosyltransferase involved in cell wall biosynthesis